MKKLTYPKAIDLPDIDSFGEIAYKLMHSLLWKSNYTHIYTDNWTTEDTILEKEFVSSLPYSSQIIYQTPQNTYIIIQIEGQGATFLTVDTISTQIYCTTTWAEEPKFRHNALIQQLQKVFPIAKVKDDNTLSINFWFDSPGKGASKFPRSITVPDWQSVLTNYPSVVRSKLSELIQDFKPSHGGQLLLWHGVPGTGKTFAIRSLAYDWRHWCITDYITDPEVFFGSAEYMMGVLMLEESKGYTVSEEGKLHPKAKDGKWRLIILEDAGELLAEDARIRNGQALSRFLNLTEGLIGQGLKLLILVTTNEPLKTLHPAVARPGRCAGEIEFLTFNKEETLAWMVEQEITPLDTKKTKHTLAELYALKEDYAQAEGPTKKAIGLGK